MLHNFITTLLRFRTASLLNIIGLTTAYISLIVIGLQVITEYSHDTMYPDSDRIYRVEHPSWAGTSKWVASLSRPVIDAVIASSPEFEESAIIRGGYQYSDELNSWRVEGWSKDSEPIRSNAIKISTEFPKMFGMNILQGEGLSLDPQKVIIPQSLAEKHFGDQSPLGKVLLPVSGGGMPLTVSGVYEDFPPTSSFKNMLYRSVGDDQAGLYSYMNYELFVKLRPGVDTSVMVEKLTRLAKEANMAGGRDMNMQFRLLKFSDSYFAPDVDKGDNNTMSDISKLKLFAFIALLIIFMASINYINFAMALVPVRIRSINTRKIFGAGTSQIRWQLVGEAVGISLVAYILAIGVIVNFETLDSISFIPTPIYIADNLSYLLYLGVLAVVLGIVAGLYPAFYSTSFRTSYVLSGSFALSPKGRTLRTVLVGFQFVISIGLIVASMFMNLQFSMIRSKDLGVNKENILQLNASEELTAKMGELKSQLIGMSGVKDMTSTPGYYSIIGDQYSAYAFNDPENIRISNIHGPSNIIDFFGLKVIEGRNFVADDDLKPSNSVVVINHAAQKEFNLKIGDRLGKLNSVYDGYSFGNTDDNLWEIIGVMEDFNFKPLYEKISPLMIVNYGVDEFKYFESTVYVKVQTDDYKTLIESITTAAKSLDPDWMPDLSFLDERIEQLYREDLRSASFVGWFSFLAIVISLVGVFGLVHFEVRYRRKEIGLRKINGATIAQIFLMLSRKFVIMVFVCYAIATPLALYGVGEWLQEFAYRTELYWWVFAIAFFIVLILVLLTVIVQSYRTAKENPANSVKSE